MAHFFRKPNWQQPDLMAGDALNLVPDDGVVPRILEIVEAMDLGGLERRYAMGRAGTAPLSPGMLLAVLLYAYCHGCTSSRQIERMCRTDADCRLIVGNKPPGHVTIARFRRRHFGDLERLPKVGLISLDGSGGSVDASAEACQTDDAMRATISALLYGGSQSPDSGLSAGQDQRMGSG
jgi:transposase